LFTNIGPLGAPKAANSGPVVGFQLLHSMQKDVKGDTQEFVPDDNIWIGFVCRNWRTGLVRIKRKPLKGLHTEQAVQKHALICHGRDHALAILLSAYFEIRRKAVERPDEGMDAAR
jgi:hypothetical protein